MKCEICKQPILEEGYKYVHPICPKGEDAAEARKAKRIRVKTFAKYGALPECIYPVEAIESGGYCVEALGVIRPEDAEVIEWDESPKPELTDEQKVWFEGLEYVHPDDPFPFFRFCPCGSISQHLPIAREQVTPIQWIREHYEHRDMKDKFDKEYWSAAVSYARDLSSTAGHIAEIADQLFENGEWLRQADTPSHLRRLEHERARLRIILKEDLGALQETLDKIESFRREPVPPELTQEQKDWFEGLSQIQTSPELRECPCGSLLHRNNDAILTHYKHHMEDKVENIRYEKYEVTPGVVIPVQVNAPVLSALFFVTGDTVFGIIEEFADRKYWHPWFGDIGHCVRLAMFETIQSDIARWAESLSGEKLSEWQVRQTALDEWAVVLHIFSTNATSEARFRSDVKMIAERVAQLLNDIHDEMSIRYEAVWTDLTRDTLNDLPEMIAIPTRHPNEKISGIVDKGLWGAVLDHLNDKRSKDYSVWRLEVKKV